MSVHCNGLVLVSIDGEQEFGVSFLSRYLFGYKHVYAGNGTLYSFILSVFSDGGVFVLLGVIRSSGKVNGFFKERKIGVEDGGVWFGLLICYTLLIPYLDISPKKSKVVSMLFIFEILLR